jgi:hypothetical protein
VAFFDFLTGGPPLKKHARRVTDRDAQAEDREASAHWLSEQAAPEALNALCGRFTLQLEHGLKDKKEKELVFELLCGHGAQGAEVARTFARTNPNFQHPVRVVERVEGAAAATALLLELLAGESVDNELKPEKKHRLLLALAERKDPAIVAAAAPFLADYDEGVRNAAVEALAAQEGDAAQESLGAALLDPKEESTRIRGRIAEIFATRRWALAEGADPGRIPAGFRFEGGRFVRA